jgi:acyl-CoA oxidase
LFDKIDSFEVFGCFCLTELGFGNNAVKMETTVTYDEAKKEFVVNSPTVLS